MKKSKETRNRIIHHPIPSRFEKPAEHHMPDLPQDRPSGGNRSILVLCDSSREDAWDGHKLFIQALHHWGVPYRVRDLAGDGIENDEPAAHALVAMVQEHVGESLSGSQSEAILRALKEGTGLLLLDPHLEKLPKPLRQGLRITPGKLSSHPSVSIATTRHFITYWRDFRERVTFRAPCEGISLGVDALPLLSGKTGEPLMVAGRHGCGRYVAWGLSTMVWSRKILGFARGLDDLLWRGLVWAAKKPFALKAMPPFATMRFDDCSGSGSLSWLAAHARHANTPPPPPLRKILESGAAEKDSVVTHFNYVKMLNSRGWRPEISVFIEQLRQDDWTHLREIFDSGGAQISCHAISDGYDRQGVWRSTFVNHRGVEVETTDGPKLFHCLSNDEFAGESSGSTIHKIARGGPLPNYRLAPCSQLELKNRFARIDKIWSEKGIRPGATPNLHWRNPPSNALAHMKKRGQTFSMWTSRYNHAIVDPEAYNWRMLPYGDAGMCLDYMPIPVDAIGIHPTDFFNVQAHVFLPGLERDEFGDDVDFFRCKKPPVAGLTTHHDLELVAQSCIRHARLGLQGLFFACPLTHEMNLATLGPGEWREILETVDAGLSKYPKEFVLYDKISETARAKCETFFHTVDWDGRSLNVTLGGMALQNVPIQIFVNDSESGCFSSLHWLDPFKDQKIEKIHTTPA